MVLSKKAIVTFLAAVLVAAAAGVGAAHAETNYEWSIDLDCAECHAVQAASVTAAQEDSSGAAVEVVSKGTEAQPKNEDAADAVKMTGLEGYAAVHTQAFGFTCATCHEDSDDLARAHKKLNSGKEVKSLRRTSIGSEVCTSCHAPEDLAKATEGRDVLVDESGASVNPHVLPEVSDHESVTCADCHYAHGEVSLTDTAINACISCHHARVFECHTCHK